MPKNRYHDAPPGDHFDGTRFFNPGQPATDRSLRRSCAGNSASAPRAGLRPVPIEQARPDPASDRLTITMVGHATLLIQAAGVNMLTDLVWSDRASPPLPARSG